MTRSFAILAVMLCITSASADEPPKPVRPFANVTHDVIDYLSEYYYRGVSAEELTAAAVRGLYTHANEKIPQSIADRLARLKKSTKDERIALLADARKLLGQHKNLEELVASEAAIAEMVRSLDDPWTEYFSWEYVRDNYFGCIFERVFGIGLEVEKDLANDRLRVITPIKDGPAYRAGLRAGDRILAIRRETRDPKEIRSFKDLSQWEINYWLAGKANARIWLTVQRGDGTEPYTVELHCPDRKVVPPETILGWKRDAKDDWEYRLAVDPRIAYVRIPMIGPLTEDHFIELRKRLEKQNVQGLILDLRFNNGGLLTKSITLCEQFLPKGRVVTIAGNTKDSIEHYDAHGEIKPWSLPIVCLVNGETSDVAEIVAACLQDHKKVAIAGERSFGRSCVQDMMRIEGAGRLKLTLAIFQRPDGRKLTRLSLPGHDADEWGVSPDRGLDVTLPMREREVLRQYLNQQYWIHPANRAIPEWERTFVDRQLERAVRHLQERLPIQ